MVDGGIAAVILMFTMVAVALFVVWLIYRQSHPPFDPNYRPPNWPPSRAQMYGQSPPVTRDQLVVRVGSESLRLPDLCPFCESAAYLEVAHYDDLEVKTFRVVCSGCGASGPVASTMTDATGTWNRRSVRVIATA